MQKYEPKPSNLIEAELVTRQNVDALVLLTEGVKVVNGVTRTTPNGTSVTIMIETPIGVRRVNEGEYLVKDLNGLFYGEPAATFESKFQTTAPEGGTQ